MKKLVLSLSLLCSSLLLSSTLSSKVKNNSLVVYNSNIGLVHEERNVKVSKDDTFITYEGVASSINTDSVNIELPKGITLYSQQYRFDKLTKEKLLDAHIGKNISLRATSKKNTYEIIPATLLASEGATAIVQTKAKEILTVASSDILFQTIPTELITKPSLVWNIQAKKSMDAELKLDYLINNISFESDYILNINKDSGSLSGWITINNRSGKKFENTKLSLLAGDIHREQNAAVLYTKTMAVMESAPDVAHRAYEGYHFYTIPFKVTLANNEKTQLKFMQKENFKIQREYSVTLNNPLYFAGEIKSDVDQFIELSGFDSPLPKGVIRTYSKLNAQSILLGENRIEHTPKNTPIKLNIGKNFDVKVVQTLLARNDTKNRYKAEIHYSISNNSETTKKIELLIPFNQQRDSDIDSKLPYRFTKGNFVTFSIEVPAQTDKSFKVKYESKR